MGSKLFYTLLLLCLRPELLWQVCWRCVMSFSIHVQKIWVFPDGSIFGWCKQGICLYMTFPLACLNVFKQGWNLIVCLRKGKSEIRMCLYSVCSISNHILFWWVRMNQLEYILKLTGQSVGKMWGFQSSLCFWFCRVVSFIHVFPEEFL